MQRIIQILKYHRDVYYLKLPRKDSDDLKPISAIINTLVADISETANPEYGVFELLKFVLDELRIYAQHQTLSTEEFAHQFGTRSAIKKDKNSGRWVIQNPANPEDNLADKWNENPEIPKFFFKWVEACTSDLIESMTVLDEKFRTRMENAFGSAAIQYVWGDKYKSATHPSPRPITTNPKPYRV